LEAANRRLKEELGINTEIQEKFHFIYKANVGQGLWEHELDFVFTGIYNGKFLLNTEEVEETRYISIENLILELKNNPESFTEWFKIILQEYLHEVNTVVK
jgi:isopentenyl-diphosphate delta-isomerase